MAGSERPQVSTSKYRPLVELGKGGAATVHLAVAQGPAGFHKLAVLKRLRLDLADDPQMVDMFVGEARLAARLHHPNIVQTYETGFDGRYHYMVMEFLEGQTLENLRRATSSDTTGDDPTPLALPCLPLAMNLRILSEILAALHHAHELKSVEGQPLCVVHRDVSPHNIIVTYDGQIKLLDFGIAKSNDSENQTRTGVIKGKYTYMALEQFMEEKLDRRTDVFAVGIIMWQMLTGRRLWQGLSQWDIVKKLTTRSIPRPQELDPTIPADLEAICMKALGVTPDERFGSAEEFQQALEKYLQQTTPVSPKDIGKRLGELFSERRAEFRAEIDERLAAALSSNETELLGSDLPFSENTRADTPKSRRPSVPSLGPTPRPHRKRTPSNPAVERNLHESAARRKSALFLIALGSITAMVCSALPEESSSPPPATTTAYASSLGSPQQKDTTGLRAPCKTDDDCRKRGSEYGTSTCQADGFCAPPRRTDPESHEGRGAGAGTAP